MKPMAQAMGLTEERRPAPTGRKRQGRCQLERRFVEERYVQSATWKGSYVEGATWKSAMWKSAT